MAVVVRRVALLGWDKEEVFLVAALVEDRSLLVSDERVFMNVQSGRARKDARSAGWTDAGGGNEEARRRWSMPQRRDHLSKRPSRERAGPGCVSPLPEAPA